MTEELYKAIQPLMIHMTPEELKIIWYAEARRRGIKVETKKQKEEALKIPLIDIPKLNFKNWCIDPEHPNHF